MAGHVILDNMDNLTIKIGPWAPRNNESETAQEIAVQHLSYGDKRLKDDVV
jgi:hypothetical protein